MLSGWGQLETLANLTIAVAYLCIGLLIAVPLVRQHQLGNKLAVATALIFFSCSSGHFVHFLAPLLPGHEMATTTGTTGTTGMTGMAAMGTWWTAVVHTTTAGIAIYYLSLRRYYGRLLTTVPMFDDLTEQQRLSELEAFRAMSVARAEAEGERDFAVALMSSISEHSPALITVTDLDGHYLMVNQAWERTTGVRAEDAIGHTVAEVHPELEAQAAVLSEQAHEGPLHITPSGEVQGEQRHFSTTAFPVYDTTGAVCATCAITTDLTEGIRVNEELAAAKPVKSDALREALVNALSHETRALVRRSRREPLDPAARPLKVLVAEDNPVNQRVTELMLSRLGHSVTIVSNGRAAVEAAASETYDVVLMDVQMPELDGLEATRRIKAWSDERPQPYIVGMTANAMVETRDACVQAGMAAYLSKPVRARELSTLLTQVGAEEAKAG